MRRAGDAKGSEKRASTDARFCISEHRKICSLQISQSVTLHLTIQLSEHRKIYSEKISQGAALDLTILQ